MDLLIIPISIPSLLSILIIVAIIIFSYFKKIMITYALIFSNFIVFVLSWAFNDIIYELGFRPIYLSIQNIPQLYTLFTSMFIHGGFLHIFGNMFVFLFMGMAFEQRIGWKNFLIIYLITGIFGALTHSLLNLGSSITLIGASGAIFGILGAFAYSYPRDEVVMPVPVGIMIIMRIKVIYGVILFAVMETVIVVVDVQDNTAHFAHLGGLVSGVVLAALLIGNKGVKTKESKKNAIYYDISQVPKSQKVDFSNLKKLATTSDLKEELNRIEKESVIQVRDIWIDHFLDKAVCPKCGKPLKHSNSKIWCEDNHFTSSY